MRWRTPRHLSAACGVAAYQSPKLTALTMLLLATLCVQRSAFTRTTCRTRRTGSAHLQRAVGGTGRGSATDDAKARASIAAVSGSAGMRRAPSRARQTWRHFSVKSFQRAGGRNVRARAPARAVVVARGGPAPRLERRRLGVRRCNCKPVTGTSRGLRLCWRRRRWP